MILKYLKKKTPNYLKITIRNFYNRSLAFLSWDPWINFSYSQEGEDILLKRIFSNRKNGFYVDVGAHHPKRFSNTNIFYQMGWKGINIDPMPSSMDLFKKYRPRDINLECGVAKKKGIMKYYIFNDPAFNSFSKTYSEKIQKKNDLYFIKETINVKIIPLSQILHSYAKKQKIDFLNVDAEGLDLIVLKSNDWKKFRPRIVIVEILESELKNINKNPIVKFMKKKKYEVYCKQFNSIFFREI